MVHWSNEAQPAGVASDAAAGEDQSLAKLRSLGAEVAAEVNKIADEPDSGSIVDDGKLGRFVKMLNIHCNTMKYKLEVCGLSRYRAGFSRTIDCPRMLTLFCMSISLNL